MGRWHDALSLQLPIHLLKPFNEAETMPENRPATPREKRMVGQRLAQVADAIALDLLHKWDSAGETPR